jgi:hypothetical protein
VGHGAFSIARKIGLSDPTGATLLRHLHTDAGRLVARHGENFRWFVDATEAWLDFKTAYGDATYRINLENWLTDAHRTSTFLEAVDRIAASDSSIDPAVVRGLKSLLRAR